MLQLHKYSRISHVGFGSISNVTIPGVKFLSIYGIVALMQEETQIELEGKRQQ